MNYYCNQKRNATIRPRQFLRPVNLFYDGTNHTVNFVDENSALYAWLCRSYWGPTELTLGGPDPCVDAIVGIAPLFKLRWDGRYRNAHAQKWRSSHRPRCEMWIFL